MPKYKKLHANDPQGELIKMGYTYVGYFSPGYVSHINGAEPKVYYWCCKDKADELAMLLKNAGFMGRIVYPLYGVNVLVVVEECIPTLEQKEF